MSLAEVVSPVPVSTPRKDCRHAGTCLEHRARVPRPVRAGGM